MEIKTGEPYDVRQGKNKDIIDLLNNDTKLVIVGTMILYIPFFYCGERNYLFNWIPESSKSQNKWFIRKAKLNGLKHPFKGKILTYQEFISE